MTRISAIYIVLLVLMLNTGCVRRTADDEARTFDPRTEADEPHSALVLTPSEVDIGTLKIGQSARFRASIQNNWPHRLSVLEIKPSCGCTDVEISNSECPSGDSVLLTGKLRVAKDAGSFRHTVLIKTNCSELPVLTLEISGVAVACLVPEPKAVKLSPRLLLNQGDTTEIRIYNKSDEAVQLGQPLMLPPGLALKVPSEPVKPGAYASLVLNAGATVATADDYDIRIPTSHPHEPFVRIQAQVRPDQGLEVTPSRIRLGVVTKQALSQRQLSLSIVGGSLDKYRLRRIELPEYLEPARREERRPNELFLQFAFKRTWEGIDLGGEIVLQFGRVEEAPHPATANFSLRVPISGFVR